MRRILFTFSTLLLLASVSIWVAFADSPHFVRASASINSDGELIVNWKEAGLGGGTVVSYTAGASQSTAIYACINGGGKHPSASNKEDENGPVTQSGSFQAGKNGNINGSLTVEPLPSTLDCPNGQKFVLASVSYTGIFVQDTTFGQTANVDGTFKACLLSGDLALDPTLCP